MATPPPAGMPVLSPRAKRVLIAVVAVIAAIVIWFQFVGFYVSYAWYDGVNATEVFTTVLATRAVLFAVAGIGIAAVIFLALWMAYRSRPVFLPNDEEDPLAPYRVIISTRPKLIAVGIAILVGLICGLSAQGSWQTVQMWLHGGAFGTTDPQFGLDIGFYVFTLPMIQMVLSWLFTATVLAFLCVLITQYLLGGIRLSAGKHQKVTAQAALQLSMLVGVFVLIKAVQYWVDRYDLLFSHRGDIFTGASYTDIHAVLAAKIILMCIAAICAIGFIVGGFLKSIKLPIIALVLLVLSSIVVGGVWPLILQKVVVEPSAITREAPYINRNIAATRAAYGIGSEHVTYVDYDKDEAGIVPADLPEAEPATVTNARLLDPNLLSATFTQRAQLRNFYGFAPELSVDRYTIDGETQDYIVSAREIDVSNFEDKQLGWINQHLVYTHGNGIVAAPANKLDDGFPIFHISDISNPDGGVSDKSGSGGGDLGFVPVEQPRIYYGALAPQYAIVGAPEGTTPREYDTADSQYTYQGSGGVPVGSFFGRLIFASHYGEANFLFSSEINSESNILYHRDPRERVEMKAPFLTVDTHPYPAVVDGRIVWIVDAYTTAKNYPYAQEVLLSEATTSSRQSAVSQADREVSYIRNSVKATVDAYNGTVTLYEVKDDDPVLNAWKAVFPGLIQPSSDISEDLRSHFRYPEDLFDVQRSLLTKYSVDDPTDFFQTSNFWKVPNDPTESNVDAPQPPYYLQIAMPGESDAHFFLTTAMTWFEREYIGAYMTANSDPENYGDITMLRMPTNTQTPGPVLIQQLFNSNTKVSNYIRNNNTPGRTSVVFGNLLTLPTDKGLLYVEPIYLLGAGADAYPQLNAIAVWYNDQVGIVIDKDEGLSGNRLTVADALENATRADISDIDTSGDGVSPGTDTTGADAVTTTGTPPVTESSIGTPPPSTAPADIQQAWDAMEQAEQALTEAKASGDIAKIGAATEQLYDAVQDYLEIAGPLALNGG